MQCMQREKGLVYGQRRAKVIHNGNKEPNEVGFIINSSHVSSKNTKYYAIILLLSIFCIRQNLNEAESLGKGAKTSKVNGSQKVTIVRMYLGMKLHI